MNNPQLNPTTLKPSEATPEQLFQIAGSCMIRGDHQEAAAIYRVLLQRDSKNPSTWLNLGTALRRLGHLDAAAACAKKSLDIIPNQASALTNYGNCLAELERGEEAIAAHAAASALKPNDFLIQKNYAIALRDFGRPDQAIGHFNKALEFKPDDIQTQWDRAITYLHAGRFEEGWKAFEIRWQTGKLNKRTCSAPLWKGEPLEGKTILIFEEQGFGDSILCSRYLPLIAKQGGKIVLECKRALHRLFGDLPNVIKMTELGQHKEHVDYYISMMSLPGVFGTDISTIPPAHVLKTSNELSEQVRHLLSLADSRLKVGIVWSGSITFGNNKKRSATLDRFLRLAEIPGVQLYSLQKGPCEKDLIQYGAQEIIYDLGPHLDDFSTTAAILDKLDLVIMTDSSVAHLAGSMQRPIWNILGSRPYWLYLNDGTNTPWYPSMRLFRQPKPGDWDGAFQKVYEELEALAARASAASQDAQAFMPQ